MRSSIQTNISINRMDAFDRLRCTKNASFCQVALTMFKDFSGKETRMRGKKTFQGNVFYLPSFVSFFFFFLFLKKKILVSMLFLLFTSRSSTTKAKFFCLSISFIKNFLFFFQGVCSPRKMNFEPVWNIFFQKFFEKIP